MTAADKTLNILAVLIGFLVISSRVPGFIWPEKFKDAFRRYISLGDGAFRAIGALLIILGVCLFCLVTSHSPRKNPARIAGLVLGFAVLGAAWLHLHPELLRKALSAGAARTRGRIGRFLDSYSGISKTGIVLIASLLIGIAIGILYITHLPVTPEKFIILYCAFVIIVTGGIHFYPPILRKMGAKVAFRSPATIRWTSFASTVFVLLIIAWAILSPE